MSNTLIRKKEETKRIVYALNGRQYNSLDEIPPEYRQYFNSEFTKDLKDDQFKTYTEYQIQNPEISIDDTRSNQKISTYKPNIFAIKFVVYAINVLLSFVENQVLIILTSLLGFQFLKIPHSLLLSMLIGTLAHKLALNYSKNYPTIKVTSFGRSFLLNDLLIVRTGGLISLALNIIVYAVYILFNH